MCLCSLYTIHIGLPKKFIRIRRFWTENVFYNISYLSRLTFFNTHTDLYSCSIPILGNNAILTKIRGFATNEKVKNILEASLSLFYNLDICRVINKGLGTLMPATLAGNRYNEPSVVYMPYVVDASAYYINYAVYTQSI